MRVAAWIRRPAGFALAALLGAGCSAAPLRVEPGEAAGSQEAQRRLQASGVGAAYVSPGARFASYDAVLIEPLSVAYKSPPRRPSAADEAPGNYALDRASTDRLRRIFQRAFERELARSRGFSVVTRPGPGVLRISGHIVDLVWEVPPARGGESSFVLKTGELTLLVDVRDSRTGEPLARIGDRKAIRPVGASLGGGYENQPANNWSAVRDVASEWARILREALDALREIPYVPHVPGAR